MVLKTKSASGSESLTARSASLPLSGAVPGSAIGRVGEILDGEVQDQVARRHCAGRCAQHRENAHAGGQRPASRREYVPPAACRCRRILPAARRCLRPPSPPALHARLLAASAISAGISPSLPLPSPSRVYVYDFIRTRSTTPLKSLFGADGKWIGIAVRPKNGLHAFERALKAGAFTVEFVDDDSARKFELFAEAPDLLGLNFHAGDAIHQHQGRIGRGQRRLGVVDEDIEAGRVDQVDLFLVPLDRRMAVEIVILRCDLFVVEIGNGIALVDARQAMAAPVVNNKPAVRESSRNAHGRPRPHSGYHWFRKLSLAKLPESQTL